MAGLAAGKLEGRRWLLKQRNIALRIGNGRMAEEEAEKKNYRQRADACRRLAQTADADVRVIYLLLAEAWDKFADEPERSKQ